jgi:hypothetical protein
MKTLEVRVPYTISREELKRRMDDALVKAGDTIRANVSVMGMNFQGTIAIEEKDLLVKLGLPGMASLFSGKIKAGIEERLGSLVAG